MKCKLNHALAFAFALFVQLGFAQDINVNGNVTDISGLPIAGASVVVKGSKTGTQTDFDGNFSLKAASNSILQISFMGMRPQEVKAGTSTRVKLQESASQLETIVVVGYGTSSKKKLTDNVARVTAKDIQQIPVANVQNALVGKLAGVQITQTNGKVEGGISIRVRGAASISAGKEPLYVLDGIPLITTNESSNGAPTNPLLTLSPNEIESIDVLKDASSAAIYGARGANGVVIITTKKGKEGKATFSINLAQGVSQATNKRKWLNADQYIELFTEASINTFGDASEAEGFFDFYAQGSDWRNREVDTDWQDGAIKNGFTTDADFAVSGGDAKTKYFFSGAYNNTIGIINANELERITARTNISHKISDRFTAGMNLSFSRSQIERLANDNSFVTPMQAVAQSPLSLDRNEDGTANRNGLEYANYLLYLDNANYTTKVRRVTGKVFGEFKILPELKITSDFAYDMMGQSEDNWRGRNVPFMATDGSVFWSAVTNETFIYSNYLTYDKTIAEKHSINAVFGMEYNRFNRRYQDVTSIYFPNDTFQTPDGGAEVSGGSGSETDFSFLSQYFGRFSYAFDNKYLFKASIRRDGSSRFGINNRFGIFPAVSAGWVVSEESFLKENKVLSFLKFKGSWGRVGNAELGNFASRQLFGANPYNLKSGLSFTQPGNPELQWEKSTQVDYGVEFGLLNKINIEADYYLKDTDGLLFNVPLPISSGATTVAQNIGRLESKGVEFTLNTKNISTDNLQWNTSANLTTNKTVVKSLPNGDADLVGAFTINRVGQNVSSFYLVEYAGVDSANGDALFYKNTVLADGSLDKTTTNVYGEAKRAIVGNPFPTLMVGLTNTVNYKGIDLSFTFQGEWGASIYNSAGIYQSVAGDYFDNQTADQMNRWRNPGDITMVPQARLYGGNGTGNSTRFLGKSDFVRLRNLAIGYSLKGGMLKSVGMSSVRVYATGVNLLTFTNYQGYDPEARRDDSGIGEEFYSAPPARTIALGVNLNF